MLIPYGDRGLLIDFSDHDDPLGQVLAYQAQLERDNLDAVVDLIPAAHTLLIAFDRNPNEITLPELDSAASTSETGAAHTIEVTYDGADLDELADDLGLTPAELIKAHTETTWTAAFAGFAPGFLYLRPDPESPHAQVFVDISRRSQPRTSIPAGSVGLAGGFSAVYPQSSPGGWQLIGSTEERMWDLDRDQPALLQPGDTVRFQEKTC